MGPLSSSELGGSEHSCVRRVLMGGPHLSVIALSPFFHNGTNPSSVLEPELLPPIRPSRGAEAQFVHIRGTSVSERQKLPQLPGTSIEGVEKGGYIISDDSTGNKPDLIVLSTGSELQIAARAADELRKEGKTVRVVSLVSWELFEEQSDKYKESVLPVAVTARISIEAGCTLGWQKYVGAKGKIIGVDKFGASAPGEKIFKEYGITVESVILAAKSL
ncbi:hypothetical protein ACP70R_041918 [Stipagrostis hirtigluma subsp. patula]